jgi:hypothetical protein
MYVCMYCYMLGFLGNMTCCVSLATQQLKQRRYYGYGVVTSYEVVSCVRELVEFGRKHATLYRGR